MATGILGTAVSGLMAFQRSLDTTSHNIANANTEGYSRQRADLKTQPERYTGAGFVGTGVSVDNITRSYDQFVNKQLRSSTSAFGEMDKYHKMASQVDNIMADEKTGLASALKQFFKSVNDVANDPTAIPARQVMLAESKTVSAQFNSLARRLGEFRDQVNTDLQGAVEEINTLAQGIAQLNAKIVTAAGQGSGQSQPNDLLDQRDLLVSRLAKNVDVAVVPQKDGSISVFIGQGQSLVTGPNTTALSLTASALDADHKEINMGAQRITQFLSGGEMSGILRFRDEVLDPAQKQLGVLAAGLAIDFNRQHKAGFDLAGNAGVDFFTAVQPEVIADPSNSGGGVNVIYDGTKIDQLQGSDYRLNYDGSNYTLTRLSDNQNINISGFPGSSVNVEGMTISQAALPSGTASFLIRPSHNTAAAMALNSAVDAPEKIAAAQTAGGTAPGDNRNALSLAALEQATVMPGGKTFQQSYTQLVSQVGSLTRSGEVSRNAQESLLTQSRETRENLVGVNLDEEAANLIKFQNAYQASAQAVSISKTVFDTLIGAVR